MNVSIPIESLNVPVKGIEDLDETLESECCLKLKIPEEIYRSLTSREYKRIDIISYTDFYRVVNGCIQRKTLLQSHAFSRFLYDKNFPDECKFNKKSHWI